MQKLTFLFILGSTFILLHGNAISPPRTFHSTKSTLCPHGVHYLDACKNSCSCDPRYGGAMCSRMADCEDAKEGACPFGDTYSDPLWGANFRCQCNLDKSQTYECFDLSLLNTYFKMMTKRLLCPDLRKIITTQ